MKIRDILMKYNITMDEFRELDMAFLQNEGCTSSGRELNTLTEWLDYHCKGGKTKEDLRERNREPYHKGSEYLW